MTEKEYDQTEGIRRSDLWKMKESPEKFMWHMTHPEEPTPALIFGTAAHKMLLEPKTFSDEFAVSGTYDRRTKEGKEAYKAFLETAGDKTVIGSDDYQTVCDMAKAVKAHPIAKKLIRGKHETALFWNDPDTGETCKVRLDILKGGKRKPMVVDYKTAANASTAVFNQKLFKYGYHMQAFMYTEAVRQAYRLTERPPFLFIVQEKTPPYSVNVIRASEDVIAAGEDEFRMLIGTYHQCKETGYWFGYSGPFDEVNETWLPGWYSTDEENDF